MLKPLVTHHRLEDCFVWFLGWTWWARRCPGSPVRRRALHSDDPEHLPFRRKRWNERHSRYPSVARDSNGRLSQHQDSHTLPTIPQGRLTKRQRQRQDPNEQGKIVERKKRVSWSIFTVYIGFCDQPPSQGSRLLNPMEVAKSRGFSSGIGTRWLL